MPSNTNIFFCTNGQAPLQALTQQTPSSSSRAGHLSPMHPIWVALRIQAASPKKALSHSPPPRQQLMIYSLPPPSRLDLIFAISSRGKTISHLTPSHPSQQHVSSLLPSHPPSSFSLSPEQANQRLFSDGGRGRGILGRGRNRKEGEGGSSSAPNGRWRLDVNWKAMLPASLPISLLHPIPLLMTGPVVCVQDGGTKKHFPIYGVGKRKVRDEGRVGSCAEIVGKSTSAPSPVDPGLPPRPSSVHPHRHRGSPIYEKGILFHRDGMAVLKRRRGKRRGG